MAEKKFAGAPFGTQTARFDVTGVHPKNKLPGSFTQMPYDKYSMVEQKRKQQPKMEKFSKMDACLQNTRQFLELTKEGLNAIKSLKRLSNKPSVEANISMKSNPWKTKMKDGCSEKEHILSYLNEYEVKRRNTISILLEADKSWNAGSDEIIPKSKPAEINGKDGVDRQEEAPQRGNSKEASCTRIGDEQAPISSSCTASKTRNENIRNDSISKENAQDVQAKGSGIEDTEETVVSMSEIIELILRNTPREIESAPQDDDKPPHEVLEGNEQSESKRFHKLQKKFPPLPVRKSINWKPREARSPCEKLPKRKLGPGAYNTVVGGFSHNTVEHRASGPGWARQLEVERLAALPHLLYKEQWEENKMLKRKLGPGSYEIKDFIQTNNLKPKSSRGICENRAPRFDKGVAHFTPGPGTYGLGGVPQRAIEEKNQQSISTKGMLESGDRKRNLPSVGSHLGPGTYRHKTCTEEMLNKVTSLKGPYELYSGDRNKPISEGYLAAPKLADLGPGQYQLGSFVDELHGSHKKSHGVFGKMAQYPEVPTERLFLFSRAHCPKKSEVPGPGSYSAQELSKPQAVGSPGFLSSAKRDDKLSQKFFTRNFNPVGAGRYDIQKFHEAQDINGHSSVFKSKSGKPGLQMSKFLQERIRAKDVPVQDRMFISEPEKPALSRSVTVM